MFYAVSVIWMGFETLGFSVFCLVNINDVDSVLSWHIL